MASFLKYKLLALIIAWPGLCISSELIQPEKTYSTLSNKSLTSSRFMLVTAHPLATKAGYDVLKAGGTAADAAVVVQLMLNLVEPQSSGIGGGGFALYWQNANQTLLSLDGRETAPLNATPFYWTKPNGQLYKWRDAVPGGRSVGVPGTLALLDELHQKFGKLDWERLLQPVIVQARAGFHVSARLSSSIAHAKSFALDEFEPTRSYFFDENGKPLATGTLLKNPTFAAALEKISHTGTDVFYRGKLTRSMLKTVASKVNPGQLEAEDFDKYGAVWRQPTCVDFRKYNVCGMGPPSSGALTVNQILGLFSQRSDNPFRNDVQSWHIYVEASKLAFADRGMYMADMDFVDVPVDGLLDKTYLAKRGKLISLNGAMDEAVAGIPPGAESEIIAHIGIDGSGTTHFVIVDSYGDMLSMTSSIETGFGSRLMSNGFLLNNELTDFSFKPERNGIPVANRVQAGKRPRSSMSPTIVLLNNKPVLLIGSPGGARIINYVAQALLQILDANMELQSALNWGHIVNLNGKTEVEQHPDSIAVASELSALGHKIQLRDLNSGLHAIMINDNGYTGAADPRREGFAMGD